MSFADNYLGRSTFVRRHFPGFVFICLYPTADGCAYASPRSEALQGVRRSTLPRGAARHLSKPDPRSAPPRFFSL